MRVIRATAATLLIMLGACTPPVSPVMARSAEPPLGVAAGEATIRFIADVRDVIGSSHVWTIHDEKARFVGELTGVSAFEARVAPGRHTFGASALRSGLKGSLCFTGDYAAGKYYVAYLRMSNDSGIWQTKWLFPRPGSKTMNASALVFEKPLFKADIQAGQVYLDANRPKPCEAAAGADDINPASFGFDRVP